VGDAKISSLYCLIDQTVCMYAMCTSMYVCMYVCTYVRMSQCTYVLSRMCIYVFMLVTYVIYEYSCKCMYE
jgi:hypothetical protein